MTTALQIAEKAIEIADQNPDFVYTPPNGPSTDCLYVSEGKGSCLFGQAILALRVEGPEYLNRNKDYRIGGLLREMEDAGVLEKSDLDVNDTLNLRSHMTGAQIAQDDGLPWADAVAELREFLGQVKA